MVQQKREIEAQAVPGEVTDGPRLEMSGRWLEEAGFPAGARVSVSVVEPGRLVVTREDVEGPVPSLLPLVWIPAERLAGRATPEVANHG